MGDEKDKKILPPYTHNEKNKSVIDWDALTRMYLDQKMSASDFLSQFKNIDLTKKKTVMFLKRWEEERQKQRTRNYNMRRNAKTFADNNLIDHDTMFKRIELLRSRQAISDHEAAECVRHALMAKVNQNNATVQELALISKSLELIQKIQNIALGLPEKCELLPNQQVEDKTNVETPATVPTYVVQMNDNGKFKTSKPRQIK